MTGHCQFCGGEEKRQCGPIEFQCGTVVYTGGINARSAICYERQLAQQAEIIREAREVITRCVHAFDRMRMVDKYHLLYGEDDSVEQIEKDLAGLIPKMKAVED